jgi:hypothetical protein
VSNCDCSFASYFKEITVKISHLFVCIRDVPESGLATGKFQYRPDFTGPVPEFGSRQYFDLTAL